MKQPRRTKERITYWQTHVNAFQKSGLTQREYCRQNSISYWSFNPWNRKLAPKEQTFHEVKREVVKRIAAETNALEILVDDGIKITVPNNFRKETLRDILDVLGIKR